MVLEPRQPVVSSDPAAQSTAPTLDSALADSQVQVLTSERNLRYVFDVHHLENDPEFADGGFSLIGWTLAHVPFLAAPPLSAEEQARRAREIAFQNFAGQVSAKRLAQSYAFELSFYATTPEKAARLGNAVTMAYIRDKAIYNIAAAAAQRGGDFLQNRVADTKAELDAATTAVRTGDIPDFVFGHADARIVSSALAPLTKTYPKTTLILALALLAGLFSGAGAAIVADEIDRRVRSARRLWAMTGLGALAALPKIRRRPATLLGRTQAEPQSPFAAEMRKLRVAAMEAAASGAPTSIGVLSWRRGEGRSLAAAELAALVAAAGTPVALVDGDVLNPALTRAFAPQAESGLADAGSADPSEAVRPLANNLVFLPACAGGVAPDPNCVSAFPVVAAACAALARSRLVIADLPALSESPEGAAAARSMTGVFVVVDAEATTVDEIVELLNRLAEHDAHVLGFAINKARAS